jgi:hypothetical protein
MDGKATKGQKAPGRGAAVYGEFPNLGGAANLGRKSGLAPSTNIC